jgi:hypothetical protein
MFKIIYQVPREEQECELDWLREQMVFPAMTDRIDFKTGKSFVMFGVIVGNDAALSIKLRHQLISQINWAVGQKK